MKKFIPIIGLVFLFVFSSFIHISLGYNVEISDIIEQQLTFIATKEYLPHEPIYIDGNIGFIVGQNGIVSGNGTYEDPYLIKGWEINASTSIGIYIKNCDVYFVIDDCFIHDGGSNHSGIVFQNVINGIINQMNILENYGGIILDSKCKKITISNCSVFYNYLNGIISEGSMINIIDNYISYNLRKGIDFYSINSTNNYNIIKGNIISNNKNSGIDVSDTYNSTFNKNIIFSNLLGITLSYSNDNIIVDNAINSNLDSGIYLYSCFKNNISQNNISKNGQGIEFIRSNNNYLFKNNIDSNKYYNIWFYGWSNKNVITINNITNSKIGIYFPEACFNKIQQNNLIKNQFNVFFMSSPNSLDENYWGRVRIFPKVIFGTILFVPWINIDWHPAKEPYDI